MVNNLSFKFKKASEKDVRIIIGKLLSKDINKYLKGIGPDRVFIITDSFVGLKYGLQIQNTIKKQYPTYLITHPPGEKHKNIKTIGKIIKGFFAGGGTYRSCICALGGGVTDNMAGFAASIIFRGIKLVHLPTTLLAQLDSAPDVKQSINAPTSKNAIGSYKTPDLVLIDPMFLKTLSEREIKSGIAEALKHGFAQNPQFVEFIVSSNRNKNLSNINILEKIIHKTILLKIKHWEETPNKWSEPERVERLTHLGHTIGKSLEIIDVDYLTHGEAISHGMLVEFYISYLLDYLKLDFIIYARKIFESLGLLYPLNNLYTVEGIVKDLYPTESVHQPIFALLTNPGNPKTISTQVPKEIVNKSLKWYFSSKK
ncbi:hypothetical protein HYZ78_00175 [Candidatus Microgenomates bacterium]|nr:hypothetical protein [Candidatus Microgenomates bacterium]